MRNQKLTEKCGVFGVIGPNFQAARLVHPGLWALQHRGQESSGHNLILHKEINMLTDYEKDCSINF